MDKLRVKGLGLGPPYFHQGFNEPYMPLVGVIIVFCVPLCLKAYM
jgi:hypothetical protein